jgi:uncharacterized delta-60 repeat protein
MKSAAVVLLVIFSVSIFAFVAQAAGEVDLTFNASTYLNQNTGVTVVAAQPDGKMIIGGSFTVASGVTRHGLARFNADGALDGTFNPPDFYDPTLFPSLGATIAAIALQSNGKILVGGRFNILGSTYRNFVRLNADGSLDTSFNNISSIFTSSSHTVNRIVVWSDDTILIMGSFGDQVLKLESNGALSAGFDYVGSGGNPRDIAVQADGKFFVSDQVLERHVPSGAVDGTYPLVQVSGGSITRIIVQPDGKVLIGGTFTSVNGFTHGRIARINADGSVDLTFNTNGIGANGGQINDVALAPDGKALVAGTFTTFNGANNSKVVRLNADGALDNTFAFNPFSSTVIVLDADLLPSGKLMIVGTLGPTVAGPETVMRINADGTYDATIAVQITRQAKVRKVMEQADGKVLACGEFQLARGAARNSLARFNADGSLDTSFVPYFNTLTNQFIYALGIQPDGKILVGAVAGIALKRLNSDGSQDTGFVQPFFGAPTIFDIYIQPDGKILVAGDFRLTQSGTSMTIARLNANGSLDGTFNPIQPNARVFKIQPQSDGKIFIGGDFTQIGATVRGRFARLNSDGSLDNTFNPPGGANSSVNDLDIQTDGKVVVAGAFTSLNGSGTQQRVGRLNADGSLDASFSQTANAALYAVKIQPDGKILIGGVMTSVGGVERIGTARLNSNGSLDFGFVASAYVSVLDINLQTDNKILMGGDFTEVNNTSSLTVARLLNPAAPIRPLFDFDGDGKADVSVFRPSTNRWYLYKSSDSTVSETTFGLAGDVAAPADYDGDGRTDIAIFRPSSGDWWSLSSINGAQIFAHWGANGDIPRPSDFDGDGRTDYVVFRPSGNFWYRISSGNGVSSNGAFGLAGDKAVVGDFDGDGKSDKAIYRPSTGDWWYQSSVNGAQLAVRWGISTDVPAPADYDGDGRTDFAVYRPSTGVWYVINSNNGSFLIMAFGIPEDKPVPADYDGDGKADIAVFRPSTGIWYQMKTTAGFSAQQFGVSTDIPTENAFVP